MANAGGDLFKAIGEHGEDVPPIVLSGNVIFGNDGDALAHTSDAGDNFSADPWFCNRFGEDYTLQEGSLCLPENSPGGELIGALGMGCTAVPGELRIVPRTVNLEGKETIKAAISVDGTDGIDPTTARLNGVVEPVVSTTAAVVSTKGDTRPQLIPGDNGKVTLEFDAADLAATLDPSARKHTVTLTAQLADGRPMRAIDEIRVIGLPPAGVETLASETETPQPIEPGLQSITPNPFNPTTRIRYGLTRPGHVRLVIYDVAGRVVARLIDNDQEAGNREIEWNADAVASGVYFARLTTPEGAYTSKLIVVK